MFQRACLYLLSLSLLLMGCQHMAANPEALQERADARVEQAVAHVWTGELALARTELAGVLEEAPRHPGALKVQTCVLLELGALDEAAGTVDRLREVSPEQPEVAVLSALVEQRRQTPAQDWREALIQAWNQTGRPDFRDAEGFPRPPVDLESFTDAVWKRTQSVEARFTAVLGDGASDARQQWLADHLSEIQAPALLLAAYEYFQPRPEDALNDVRLKARQSLRRRLEPLVAGASDSEGPLLLLLGESAKDAPLMKEELQALERIAALPRFRSLSLAQASAAAKQRLESTGITPQPARLFQAATAWLVLDATLILKKRVEATKDHLSSGERIRLGQSVYTLGARIAEGPMLVDHMVGLSQMRQGAALMDDAAKLAQVTQDLEHARAVYQATSSLQVDTWPLPSLHRDWLQAALDDEWKSLSALVTP
ncbi:hypothetical protein JYK02_23735 [Corallococcus macrosporus]|uniref:Tetratricopeptide repeat protein n=1 Tax=Corallococcus macrosporus TaxID=35 RepID=A0ABS3DGT7_9BACT|nr:hypothetical protein [Corallococcus macrosporus]MBN8230529.1 hypothetical protein [Corallococcus macrosporus]